MKMCQAFAKKGHQVKLLASKRNTQEEKVIRDVFSFYNVDKCFGIKKLPYIDRRKSKLLYIITILLYPLLLLREIKCFQPNIFYGRKLDACYFSVLLRYNTIFESHSPEWFNQRQRSIAFRIMVRSKKLEKIIVISESLKKKYLKTFFLNPNIIDVVPDASDEVKVFERLKSWPGRKGILQVGYVGHLYQGKGMEVVSKLPQLMPDVDFHIIGGLVEDIIFWKKRLKSKNVYFHGFVPQNKISRYINSLDVCLLPNQKSVFAYVANSEYSQNISDYTSPLKLFEYMAHKKAIIASDLPVLREVLSEENSILVPPDDICAWKDAIIQLKDEKLRNRLGQAAHREFIDKYTWGIRAQRVLN